MIAVEDREGTERGQREDRERTERTERGQRENNKEQRGALDVSLANGCAKYTALPPYLCAVMSMMASSSSSSSASLAFRLGVGWSHGLAAFRAALFFRRAAALRKASWSKESAPTALNLLFLRSFFAFRSLAN